MPKNVLNLELSSGGFSTGAVAGVVALEASVEFAAEAVAEPGRVVSEARSAMGGLACSSLFVLCRRRRDPPGAGVYTR